jgi:hypothetical protein
MFIGETAGVNCELCPCLEYQVVHQIECTNKSVNIIGLDQYISLARSSNQK